MKSYNQRARFLFLPWLRVLMEDRSLFRLLIGALIIYILMTLLNPGKFFTWNNFTSMAFQFPELGIFSLAIMITLITGGIDLSIVSIANLSGLMAAFLLTANWADQAPAAVSILAVVIAIVTSAFLGFMNGVLIAYLRITPILATLGTMQLFMGIAFVLTKGYAAAGYPEAFLDDRSWHNRILAGSSLVVYQSSHFLTFIIEPNAIWALSLFDWDQSCRGALFGDPYPGVNSEDVYHEWFVSGVGGFDRDCASEFSEG